MVRNRAATSSSSARAWSSLSCRVLRRRAPFPRLSVPLVKRIFNLREDRALPAHHRDAREQPQVLGALLGCATHKTSAIREYLREARPGEGGMYRRRHGHLLQPSGTSRSAQPARSAPRAPPGEDPAPSPPAAPPSPGIPSTMAPPPESPLQRCNPCRYSCRGVMRTALGCEPGKEAQSKAFPGTRNDPPEFPGFCLSPEVFLPGFCLSPEVSRILPVCEKRRT